MFCPPAPTTSMPGPGRFVEEPPDVAVRTLKTCMPATKADESDGRRLRFHATLPSSVRTRLWSLSTLREPSMLLVVYSSTSYRKRENEKPRVLTTSQPAT